MSCSPTKYVADGDYLLRGTTVKSDTSSFNANQLTPYMRQRPNSKWFSLFNLPLDLYNLSGRDSTKWANCILRSMGEAPVVYDSLQVLTSCRDMVSAMNTMGVAAPSTSSRAVWRPRRRELQNTIPSSPNPRKNHGLASSPSTRMGPAMPQAWPLLFR